MEKTKTTLDQWFTLQAIVDYGGFAQAAEALHKTQSSISYTINKLEQTLDTKIFVLEKRRAILTKQGEQLLELSREMTNKAISLETTAKFLNKNINNKIKIITDTLYKNDELIKRVGGLIKSKKNYDIELDKKLLTKSNIMALKDFDLLITHHYIESLNPILLGEVEAVLVIDSNNKLKLHQMDKVVQELEYIPQIVLSSSFQDTIKSIQMVKVDSIETAITLVKNSVGYAWLPKNRINEAINDKSLIALENTFGKMSYKFYMYMNKNSSINDMIINYLFYSK
ncbi:HTH-type transcriptional activator AllS [Providencia rustigianii]|nr:LysR family transcriptional regulator [Providencia rustigianii]SPY77488.1 HTH-type transcriptional activator AllS [Providencia rustigianii]SUC26876.1 HTH-type transcriptional activator AllS [Providencia rustigianii]VEB69510.1 HTH-type transcriptional activator AllS [Providencia rustigianii]